MDDSVKPRSPRYRSTLRAEQASLTKRRVLEAAARLFLERGYTGTTVAAVAEAADVAPETIYAAFQGKRGLLEGVIDEAIAPDGNWHDDLVDELTTLPTAGERLRGFVGLCCQTLSRTSRYHVVIRGAADSEAFAVALRARLLDVRLARTSERLARLVPDALRPGLSHEQAAQRFSALLSPELHNLLITEYGWSPAAYEAWVASVAEAELLGSAPADGREAKTEP